MISQLCFLRKWKRDDERGDIACHLPFVASSCRAPQQQTHFSSSIYSQTLLISDRPPANVPVSHPLPWCLDLFSTASIDVDWESIMIPFLSNLRRLQLNWSVNDNQKWIQSKRPQQPWQGASGATGCIILPFLYLFPHYPTATSKEGIQKMWKKSDLLPKTPTDPHGPHMHYDQQP